MITSIRYTNIKGRSNAHALKAVNLVVGDNSSGKTALLDSLDIATIGYLARPQVGRTNSELFKLASGPYMEVEATLSDGRRNTVRLEKKRDQMLKEAKSASAMQEPPSST